MKKIFFLIFMLNCFISNCQTWVNNQAANYGISVPNLTVQGTAFVASDSTIYNYRSHYAIDAKHNYLYVADFSGHRVLRFNYPITKNQPKATLVFGQPSFNSIVGNTSQSQFIMPCGIAVDSVSGTLWVLDGGAHRILRFDSAHKATTNGINADQVLGQFNFFNGSPGISQSTFSIDVTYEDGNLLFYDHATGSLWIADNANNRALCFNNAKTLANGAPANMVIGQANFTSVSSGCSAALFGGLPLGITMIGNSLFVSDRYNHRVLRFDNIYSKPNGGSADAVFGQSNFTTSTAGCSATQMSIPTGITADNTKLYVSEWFNGRITIFNNATTNTVATNVLWAATLNSPGSSGCSPTSGFFCESLTIDPVYNQLFIGDPQNKRIMVYNAGVVSGITNEKARKNEFLLYPNPTSGELILKTEQKENLQIVVYNVLGEIILKQNILETESKISLKEHATGIYFVKILENGKPLHNSKIIKQ